MVHEFNHTTLLNKVKRRKEDSHKRDHGRVLVFAGSEGMGGAGLLCSEACLFLGAGLVDLYTHPSHVVSSLSRTPEVMVHGIDEHTNFEKPEKFDGLLCGPGMKNDLWSQRIFQIASRLEPKKGIVFDAGAFLFLKPSLMPTHIETVLTPHPGEAAFLLGTSVQKVQENRKEAALKLSEQYRCHVILKGYGSLVVDRDSREVYICTEGGPELATAGSGDVLAGVVSALLVQGIAPLDACLLSVALHARAGEIFRENEGEKGLNASALIPVIRRLLNERSQ